MSWSALWTSRCYAVAFWSQESPKSPSITFKKFHRRCASTIENFQDFEGQHRISIQWFYCLCYPSCFKFIYYHILLNWRGTNFWLLPPHRKQSMKWWLICGAISRFSSGIDDLSSYYFTFPRGNVSYRGSVIRQDMEQGGRAKLVSLQNFTCYDYYRNTTCSPKMQ